MKRKVIILLFSVLLVFSLSIPAFATHASGLLYGVTTNVNFNGSTAGVPSDISNLTDGDHLTETYFASNNSALYKFDIPVNISSFYIDYVAGSGILYFFNGSTQLGTHVINKDYDMTSVNYSNVTHVSVASVRSSLTLAELDVYTNDVDTTAPSTPTGVTATAGDGSVTLDWTSNTETDLSGYNVYQSTDNTTFTKVNTSLITTNSYSVSGLTNDTTYYFTVSAEDTSGNESDQSTSVSSTPTAPPDNSNVALDITTLSDTVNATEEFTIDVALNNATDVYAEDVKISYDTNLFELVSSGVGYTGLYFYHKDESTPGSLRYIIASQGDEYGINSDTTILQLTFRAKNVQGTGNIDIVSGLVADSQGNEYTPTLDTQAITVNAFNADVNNDGFYTLGDLAIASNDYGKTTGNLSDDDSDVDLTGLVDDVDLNTIVDAILENE